MTGTWVNDPAGKHIAVVFVHGILSSSQSGWTHDNGVYWPKLLNDSLRGEPVAIYTYTYKTSLGSGAYSIDNAAELLNALFDLDGLSRFHHVLFVCHSMGGLVARRFLVRRHHEYRDTTFSFFMVASPTQGADYASWLAPLARLVGHAQVDALRVVKSNPWLASLNSDFIGLVRTHDIVGRELVEDESIFQLGGFFRKPVVSPLAAGGLFADPLKIPGSDHFSISKPDGPEAIQQRMLLAFVKTTIGHGSTPSPAGPHTPDAQDLQRLILLGADEEKIAFIGSIKYGAAVHLTDIPQIIAATYGDTLQALQVPLLVAHAARLVVAADPAYQHNPRLIAMLPNELLPNTNPVPDIVFSMFLIAATRGPRMLAGLLLCAPQQAVHAAGAEIAQLLNKLREA